MRATQRCSRRYCRDAGGQLINRQCARGAPLHCVFQQPLGGCKVQQDGRREAVAERQSAAGNGTLLEDAC